MTTAPTLPPAAPVNEARCYTYDEASELTGLSPDFWRREVADGRIAYTRFGRGSRNDRIRIPHGALVAYLAGHTIPAAADDPGNQ